MVLPPIESPFWAGIGHFYDSVISWLPGQTDLPLYLESRYQYAAHYWEAEAALEGESPAVVRRGKVGRMVLSVAVPIQRYRQVLASLMLSKSAWVRTRIPAKFRNRVLLFAS